MDTRLVAVTNLKASMSSLRDDCLPMVRILNPREIRLAGARGRPVIRTGDQLQPALRRRPRLPCAQRMLPALTGFQ
jgi:hypothetical protein